MHCKNCLKKSVYFSNCMHPYCESCYKNKTFCESCRTGKNNSIIENILKYLNIY